MQELEPSFKVSTSSLQQQRWQIPNVDIDHSCTKDGSRNGVFTRESHAACSKRSVAKVNPSGKKHLKFVVSINEEHIRTTPALPDSIQEHCTRVENNRSPAEFSMSMHAEILIPYNPSKNVISEDFDHTNNYNSLKGEGINVS